MAPIDWDECWSADLTPYDEGWTHGIAHDIADTMAAFLEREGIPGSIASFGCGPATTLLDLAERYPSIECYGYDVSEAALELAREARDERGLGNASFAVDELPDLATTRSFGVVYCVATLHYVRDTAAALEALFDRVEPGGHLVCSHPTPRHETMMENYVEDARSEEGPFGDRDAAWVRDRFRHTLEGENTLTPEEVGALLGRPVRDLRDIDGVSAPEDLGEGFPFTTVGK